MHEKHWGLTESPFQTGGYFFQTPSLEEAFARLEFLVDNGRQLGIDVTQEQVPIADEVQGLCELFGFEPIELANEGTFVLAVPKEQGDAALEILRFSQPTAAIIGTVVEQHLGKVVLTSPWGSQRYLELPKGELLPRIC